MATARDFDNLGTWPSLLHLRCGRGGQKLRVLAAQHQHRLAHSLPKTPKVYVPSDRSGEGVAQGRIVVAPPAAIRSLGEGAFDETLPLLIVQGAKALIGLAQLLACTREVRPEALFRHLAGDIGDRGTRQKGPDVIKDEAAQGTFGLGSH